MLVLRLVSELACAASEISLSNWSLPLSVNLPALSVRSDLCWSLPSPMNLHAMSTGSVRCYWLLPLSVHLLCQCVQYAAGPSLVRKLPSLIV
eukprot:3874828-Amphidinium_carterae.1